MASMNFCPYPVEPWKLIMMTTYPFAANSSGFQRKLQSSPQAPCGPPWMRNFTGYFLPASKFRSEVDHDDDISVCGEQFGIPAKAPVVSPGPLRPAVDEELHGIFFAGIEVRRLDERALNTVAMRTAERERLGV